MYSLSDNQSGLTVERVKGVRHHDFRGRAPGIMRSLRMQARNLFGQLPAHKRRGEYLFRDRPVLLPVWPRNPYLHHSGTFIHMPRNPQ